LKSYRPQPSASNRYWIIQSLTLAVQLAEQGLDPVAYASANPPRSTKETESGSHDTLEHVFGALLGTPAGPGRMLPSRCQHAVPLAPREEPLSAPNIRWVTLAFPNLFIDGDYDLFILLKWTESPDHSYIKSTMEPAEVADASQEEVGFFFRRLGEICFSSAGYQRYSSAASALAVASKCGAVFFADSTGEKDSELVTA
jgi:hypothetical protein